MFSETMIWCWIANHRTIGFYSDYACTRIIPDLILRHFSCNRIQKGQKRTEKCYKWICIDSCSCWTFFVCVSIIKCCYMLSLEFSSLYCVNFFMSSLWTRYAYTMGIESSLLTLKQSDKHRTIKIALVMVTTPHEYQP